MKDWIPSILVWAFMLGGAYEVYKFDTAPEMYGPPIPTHEQRCKQAGGTWLFREGKCIAIHELTIN